LIQETLCYVGTYLSSDSLLLYTRELVLHHLPEFWFCTSWYKRTCIHQLPELWFCASWHRELAIHHHLEVWYCAPWYNRTCSRSLTWDPILWSLIEKNFCYLLYFGPGLCSLLKSCSISFNWAIVLYYLSQELYYWWITYLISGGPVLLGNRDLMQHHILELWFFASWYKRTRATSITWALVWCSLI
jgi:hypothetical protein